ncbi:membrane-associated phospholipid phosphatase [Chitinophaga polysaccharea]|uniref:Membrane-associated phospholipid phosphatase n=1 Tax=Chitinophaga polysaccharea TaxID=1293035 RepID=A0A561PWW2_9BACT|nr:phosphatase PAP2 family protein [Chitinophaga polysaccharea]TWF42595.1 membrane-associated phospholipid phosphatase [Chitinophaga polysaccharea]
MRVFLERFKQVTQRLALFLWPLITVLLGILLARLTVSRTTAYFFINHLHTPAGDLVFPYITELGSTVAAILLSAALLVFHRRIGMVLGSAYLFTAAIGGVLKIWIGFPRPHRYFEHRLHDIYFVPGVQVLDNFRSFPSGHTICAFTAATVLAYYAHNRYWSLLYLVLAMLVGYSRMYMSQHFLEDVTAGAIIGVFFTMVWLSIFGGKEEQLSR